MKRDELWFELLCLSAPIAPMHITSAVVCVCCDGLVLPLMTIGCSFIVALALIYLVHEKG